MSTYIAPARSQPYGAIFAEQPQPEPEPDMQPVSPSTFLAIPRHLVLGAFERFRNEACHRRDQVTYQAHNDDGVPQTNPDGSPIMVSDQTTGGAAAFFFWPAYLGTIGALHQNGHAPINGDWTDASVKGYVAACEAYWRAVGNPHGGPVTPPVPPSPGGSLQGRLRVDGRMFVNDAGDYRPVWASCLAAFRPGHDPRPALDEIAALGFGGVRMFAGPLPWCNQSIRDVYERLPGFMDATLERALHVEVTCLTETGMGYDAGAHLVRLAELLDPYEHALIEFANEWQHPTQRLNLAWLRQMAGAHLFMAPIAIGAPNEDEPSDPAKGPQTWNGTGGSYGTAHLDRGRDTWNQCRRVREIMACSEFGKFPVLNNEPIGAAEPGTPGQRRWDPEFFFTLGALNRLFEVGGVFHSQAGLMAERMGPVQRACAEAFVRGSRVWPHNERLRYLNVGHTGSPITSARFNEGENRPGVTRAYSGIAGNRGLLVVLGIVGEWTQHVTFGNGWRVARPIDAYPGVVAVEVTR